jgi:hypothetical protein
MNLDTFLNLTANIVLTASVSIFTIFLYRSDGAVRRWPMIGSYLLRLSLVAIAVGGLGNCLTLSTPPHTEVLLNIGTAGLFAWAAWFHHNLLKDE